MIDPSAILARVAIAHPLTEPYSLPISPLLAAVAAMFAVLAVAIAWPERNEGVSRAELLAHAPTDSWSGSLSVPQAAARAGACLLTLLAIAAGRLGVDDELENLAPALIVGVSWPVLVLLSIAAGRIWRWVDPWDGAARAFFRDEPAAAARVWPALLPAFAWVWYLSVLPAPLSPRAVGAALGSYTIFTLAGCLAAGRARWLSSAEPLGLVLSWMALLPTRQLRGWRPPPGAEPLLGVLAGGILFGAVRRSELWGALNVAPAAMVYATLGLLLSCAAVGGLLLFVATAAARLHPRSLMARAALPPLAAIIVAVALERNRLFTSLQLLPGLVGDPFGWGWDLLGPAGAGLFPAPLGITGLAIVQLTALVAGYLGGAIVVGGGAPRLDRGAAAATLGLLAGCSVVALLAH